jgi:hypothetical protein
LRIAVEKVPVTTLAKTLEAAAAHPSDIKGIAGYAGFSVSTAKRTLPTLETLNVVERDSAGVYRCKAQGASRGMSDDQATLLLRSAVQNFRPFEAICEGLALGESVEEATRRAAMALQIPKDDAPDLSNLISLGVSLGCLENGDGKIRLNREIAVAIQTEESVISEADLESEAKVRLYNASRLGRDANQFLDATDRTLLAEAMLEFRSDPPQAVEKAGQALEDYLRELANAKGFAADAKTCNGAGQLASMLVGKGVIHSHHNNFVQAMGTARNAKAHKKDKKTLKPWAITPFGAFWVIAGSLAIIRSIHEYVFRGDQTL